MPLSTALQVGSAIFGASSARSASRRQMQFNREEAQKDRDFQSGQAARQMEFQERMRSTAYQTAMQDMKTAGLNPILAYQQGGAPMAAGAAGSGSKASGALGQTPSEAAMHAASAVASIRNMHEQNQLLKEQTNKTRQEGRSAKARADRAVVSNSPFTGLLRLFESGALGNAARRLGRTVAAGLKSGGSARDYQRDAVQPDPQPPLRIDITGGMPRGGRALTEFLQQMDDNSLIRARDEVGALRRAAIDIELERRGYSRRRR